METNKQISWVFDVDGVLCNPNQPIDKNFKKWFLSWSKNLNLYLITGGEREKTIKQLGIEVVERSKIVFNCMGNSIWDNGKHLLINQFTLTEEEIQWFDAEVNNSKFSSKTGKHIEMRPGSFNFSIVGRNANTMQRTSYKIWDGLTNERLILAEKIEKRFPKFEAYLGGDTSLDICLKNANKGQCMDIIRSQDRSPIYFFGDRCFPRGIDEPFAAKCVQPNDKVFEVNSYQDTWNVLKKFSL
jgi:phosphomannomutase